MPESVGKLGGSGTIWPIALGASISLAVTRQRLAQGSLPPWPLAYDRVHAGAVGLRCSPFQIRVWVKPLAKIAYFDCPTGIAGDMCVGALIHLGLPLDYLQAQLAKLGIKQEYSLGAIAVQRHHQAATHFQVEVHAQGNSPGNSPGNSQAESHRTLPAIAALIEQADLPPRAAAWSLAVFENLAIAEGAVHGIDPNQVHFHEVGAVDAIVDIIGTALGLDYLNIDQIHCSALPTGGGTVWAAHGRLPVPAPAVLRLLAQGQVPIYSNGILRELVTPTGAAIAITLAQRFGPPPRMRLHSIGLGAGSLDLALPNILRIWLGESEAGEPEQPSGSSHPAGHVHDRGHGHHDHDQARNDHDHNHEHDHDHDHAHPAQTNAAETDAAPETDQTPTTIALLQTQLDDISPQAIGYAFDRLLEAGALDVFTQAIAMKKNRPGILLTVLCSEEKIAPCETILFRETSTLGIRRQLQHRHILHRRWETVATAYGPVRIKVAEDQAAEVVDIEGGNGAIARQGQPEYEDCAAIARRHHRPWREIHQLALQAWSSSQLSPGSQP